MRQVGVIIFRPMVKKLLNIKQKYIENSFKSKQKKKGNLGMLLVLLEKLFKWIGFSEGGLEFFKPKV